MRVLLAEENIAAGGVTSTLRAAGFIVDHSDMGREVLEMVRRYDYDLILLDLMLPDIRSFEVVRSLRAARFGTPVVVLSALSTAQAMVKAFSGGVDDFITKPFDDAELVARMQAILRRSKGYSESTLRVGSLQLTLDSRMVCVDGQAVQLSGKEYAMLELLVLRKGTLLSKDAFFNHLYGGIDEPGMKIIGVFICKLRKKLKAAGAGHLISTVWGQGYMLREETRRSAPVTHAATLPTAEHCELARLVA